LDDPNPDPRATAGPDGEWRGAHRRLLDEILQEARDRRASGDLPADFERELDTAFAQLVPRPRSEDSGELIARAEHAAMIDPVVPAVSGIPGGAAAKRAVKRAMFWYVNFVTDQVRDFANASTRVMRMLDHRITRLEDRVASPDADALVRLGPLLASVDVAPWIDDVVRALAGVDGRVLHGECGRGELVERLVSAGLDAYGVEPRFEDADVAALAGLEAHCEGVLEHLETVADRALGAVVLSGTADALTLPAKLRCFDEVARALRPRGRFAILATRPERWGAGRTALHADLAPDARPLHAETWPHVLGVSGFEDVAVHTGQDDGETFLVTATRDAE
jgi:SAM-dependent methyltransferase